MLEAASLAPEAAPITVPPPLARFDGAAAWSSLTPDQQTRIGALAMELGATWSTLDEQGLDFEPVEIRRGIYAAQSMLMAELPETLAKAIPSGAFYAPDGTPRVPSCIGDICRFCGCTQSDACPDGCGWCAWAAPGVCTTCAKTRKLTFTAEEC